MDEQSLMMLALITLAAVVAPFLADRVEPRLKVPSVVFEILLGVLLGPALLDLVEKTDVVDALSDLGLAFLLFLAGYEIEVGRVVGGPLRRATWSWLVSLGMGLALGLAVGGTDTGLVVGLALTTTALGVVLPLVRDAGLSGTRFGDGVLAVGTIGEFGPILAIAFVLSGQRPGHTLAVLAVFAALALAGAWLARQPRHPRLGHLVAATLGTSSQVAVRLCVFLVIGLFAITEWLGLDPVLGAFTAGLLVRVFLHSSDPAEAQIVGSRLEGIGFGFLIPIFYVVTGVALDVPSLVSDPAVLVTVPVFLVLLLVVRGLPTFLFHRRELGGREALALSTMASTALPLIVVITTAGVSNGALDEAQAAALVCSGVLSVLLFPALAERIGDIRPPNRPSAEPSLEENDQL
ncbi:cation:proton antiporter [Myceligenerans xiligouense]|uniref:Transporter (CPA2 family) n=1 Tax=Myceligenerans xiligouense TaxID=253184 RepID=A0A3N4YIJ7_9MICO|nr:cation:proton antiporter [Myceligenerans xiligouense]RPF19927.1 transporter (CPA2 family) [Myceligenerans xiligouense]